MLAQPGPWYHLEEGPTSLTKQPMTKQQFLPNHQGSSWPISPHVIDHWEYSHQTIVLKWKTNPDECTIHAPKTLRCCPLRTRVTETLEANDEHLDDIKVLHEPRELGLGDPPNTSLGHGLVLVTLASSLRVLLRWSTFTLNRLSCISPTRSMALL